jgi:hypothetical protein
VLYDKATKKFGQITLKEMHDVFQRAGLTNSSELDENDKDDDMKTLFTEANKAKGIV